MRSVFRFAGGEFHPNFKLNADLRRQQVLDPELKRLADLAALGAREVAVRVAFDRGDYFGSIRGTLATNRAGLPVGRVVADDFKANWIEYGYRTIRGQGSRSGALGRRTRIRNLSGGAELGFVRGRKPLARGARKAGLRVRPRRRKGGL